jgi:Tol biopolymer transport system component
VSVQPQVFAPGVISSTAHEASPAFTPDGQTVYFSRQNPQSSAVLVSHRRGLGWTTPELAEFSGEWDDMEPAMAPDGSFMVFVSNQPARAGDAPGDGFYGGKSWPGRASALWRIQRSKSGWGERTRLPDTINKGPSVYAPSLARDGSLYFMRPAASTGKFQLFRAQMRNGEYEEAQPLPFSDGSSTDVDPAVAPDESFLIFGSGRAPATSMDLFVVFRDGSAWGEPVHLGNLINSPTSDAEARLNPDLETLYFSSERVLPVKFPRSRATAVADTRRITTWDNSMYNIWFVPLQPLLEAARSSQRHLQ